MFITWILRYLIALSSFCTYIHRPEQLRCSRNVPQAVEMNTNDEQTDGGRLTNTKTLFWVGPHHESRAESQLHELQLARRNFGSPPCFGPIACRLEGCCGATGRGRPQADIFLALATHQMCPVTLLEEWKRQQP